jgi:VCBS repeat-containing protein
LTINANGSYSFAPAANYTGAIPVVTYTVSDGNGGTDTSTLTLSMVAFNDAPGDGDETANVTEDTTLTVNAASGLLANASDVEGHTPTISAFSIAGQAGPFVVGSGYTIAGVGTLTINSDGSYSFAPAANYTGSVPVVTYTVSDGNGGTDTSTLTLSMVAVNDAPVDGDETANVTEDTTLTVKAASGLLANASDVDGHTPTISAFSIAGQAGPFAVGSGYTIPGVGTLTIAADGSYSFAPAADYAGSVPVVTYTVSDGNGGSDTSTLTLATVPVNDAPLDADESNALAEDTLLAVDAAAGLLANAIDADGDTSTIDAFSIAGQAGPFVVGTAYAIPGVGTLTIAADGAYTFAPAAGYAGAVPVVTYTVVDGNGGSNTSTLTLSIVAVNDPPVDADEAVNVMEDTPLAVAASAGLLANATDDEGNALVISGFSVAGQPGPFAVGAPTTITGVGTLTIALDGSYTFVPAAGYAGPVPAIAYTVADGNGGLDTSTLTLAVAAVNDAPVAVDDRFDTDADTPLVLTLPENDRDADDDALRVTHIDGVALAVDHPVDVPGGQVRLDADGRVVFVPAADFTGDVRFTYTVTDASGLAATASVNGTVHPRVPSVTGAPQGWSDPIDTPPRRDAHALIAVTPPLLEAVNAIRSLRGVTALDVEAPVIVAVNGVRPLDGLQPERGSRTPVLDEAERLARSTSQADATRHLDERGSLAASVRVFEVVRDGLERALRVVPALDIAERDGWIYAMFDDDGARSEYRVTMRDGRALPAWIVDSHQGHLMIDAALAPPRRIELRVHVLRVDAAVDAFDLVIDRAAQRVHILPTDPHSGSADRSVGFAEQISLQARGAPTHAEALATLLRGADTREPLPTTDR